MLLNSGEYTLKRETNTASAGEMPTLSGTVISRGFYGSKTVGYNRYFAAQAVSVQADMLIQIQQQGGVKPTDLCLLTSYKNDGATGTYKVVEVQHVTDKDGQPMTDLTLERIEDIDTN